MPGGNVDCLTDEIRNRDHSVGAQVQLGWIRRAREQALLRPSMNQRMANSEDHFVVRVRANAINPHLGNSWNLATLDSNQIELVGSFLKAVFPSQRRRAQIERRDGVTSCPSCMGMIHDVWMMPQLMARPGSIQIPKILKLVNNKDRRGSQGFRFGVLTTEPSNGGLPRRDPLVSSHRLGQSNAWRPPRLACRSSGVAELKTALVRNAPAYPTSRPVTPSVSERRDDSLTIPPDGHHLVSVRRKPAPARDDSRHEGTHGLVI
jgi:hypothetical protein